MASKQEMRERVLGKTTVLELEHEGQKYFARLPPGDVWQDMQDSLEASQERARIEPAGKNRIWYDALARALADILYDPESKELLFDSKNPDDVKILAGAQGGTIPKLWGLVMESMKKHVTALGKESGPTAPSSSG